MYIESLQVSVNLLLATILHFHVSGKDICGELVRMAVKRNN